MNRTKTLTLALAAAFSSSFSQAPLWAASEFRVVAETGLEIGNNEKPKPIPEKKPKPVTPLAEKKATEITCSGETSFDAKAGMAVFIQEVKVNDPQFALSADKLTAYLKKAVKEAAKSGNSATPSAPPEAKADASPTSGLERAVAEGNVVITQDKVDEKTGEVTHYIGKGARADYNAATGEMTLSGWPQIQQGLNNQVATEEGTIMKMDKEGHLTTKGPSMTVIKSEPKPAKTP
ncbi:MAG: hypothetical protein NTZ46_04675 [Verrucomicrobia bacterium]|nr:hypothetical protein [Verrucomicrobiota bacterium]